MSFSAVIRIRFDGDWTKAEERILESAIADAELLQCTAATRPLATGSWLCYCKRLGDATVYMAHRAGWQRVLHAYAAPALGLRIILFSEEARRGIGGYTA